MPAYLITGTPGAGKSSIIEELKRRGYAAFSADEDLNITAHFDIATGEKLAKAPPAPIDHSKYAWNWDIPLIQKLIAENDIMFLAGTSHNMWQNLGLFDKIFVPHPSADKLKRRLLSRTNNDYGKHPDELAEIMRDHETDEDFWGSKGSVIINGDQPIKKIVDTILEYVPGAH